MIRTLQKKFVVTAMTAITFLILLLLGAINIANIVIVGNEIERTLQVVSENEGGAGNQMPKPDAAPPGPFSNAPKNDYDTFMSSNFFVVRFDQSGSVVYVDISRTSAVTEEEAKELASQIYAGGKESGKTGKFRFLMRDTHVGNGKSIVFLDTSEESFSYLRVLLLSGAIGLACWALMLLLVILLSRKAIRPIAENIEKQKQFVTNAGHEIKTPLAIIQSNTEAMELYQGENKWSKNIKEQTIRLNGLMKNLLTLARMDEGAARGPAADFSLSAMLAAAMQSFLQPMETKNITLQTDIQPEIHLHADQNQIEQLISILLDNAVKYTNANGQIGIHLQKNEKQIILRIQNTCESLPDAPPEKLFDRFYRADGARTQKNGGYGIGLSVARAIAAANNGTLNAAYLPPNRICFTICF